MRVSWLFCPLGDSSLVSSIDHILQGYGAAVHELRLGVAIWLVEYDVASKVFFDLKFEFLVGIAYLKLYKPKI